MRVVSRATPGGRVAPAPPTAAGNDGPGVPWWGVLSALAAPLLLVAGWTIAETLQPRTYNAIADTVSALAAVGAAGQWVMTLAFAAAGACEVVTGLALRPAAAPGRLILMAGGVAGVLVAANPQHAGGSLAHACWAGVGLAALVTWPGAAWRRGPSVPWGLRPAVSAVATGVMIGLLAWFLAELVTRDGQVGLAERIMGVAQAGWPLAVVLSCRLSRPGARTVRAGAGTEHAARGPARAGRHRPCRGAPARRPGKSGQRAQKPGHSRPDGKPGSRLSDDCYQENNDAGGTSMKTTISAVALTAALATGAAGVAAVAATPVAGAVTAPNATLASAAVQAQGLQPWPVLSQGPNSTWPKVTVRSLQYLLNAHGARLGVDGTFGPLTRNAVLAFQRAHHLTASGVADAATWRALVITVRKDSSGPAVRAVQDQVNFRNNRNGRTLTVDGIYGPKTQAAVRAFQQGVAFDVRGFPVDGVVGPLTWQALVTEILAA
jgi:peptidoglycan hydrolase-like protein with peptidoglycan-binding domain